MESTGQTTRFETVIKDVIYRAKSGNALTAKFVVAHHGDEPVGLIQLGRYSKNYEASKYMVCLKRKEAEWMVDSLPALKKNARSAKLVKDPIVLDEKEFGEDRGLKLQVVKVDAFKGKFSNQKNLEIVQSFVRDEDFKERSVTFSLTNLAKVGDSFKHLLYAMDVFSSIERKLEATEHIFMCYLGYLVQTNINSAMEAKFFVPIDEKLASKISDEKNQEASRAYWFLARYISLNFNNVFAELLMDIFKTLKIDHFLTDRFNENILWPIMENNWKTFVNAEDMDLYGFTKFLIDNANAV